MVQSINLIPQEEKVIQKREKIVKGSTILSVVLLIILIGASGVVYYRTNQLNQEMTQLDTQIESLRSDINDLSNIEIAARNLDKKTIELRTILDERPYFSSLLEEFEKRTPSGVTVSSLSLEESLGGSSANPESTVSLGRISVSGTGSDYLAVSNFINTLTTTKLSSASAGLEAVFPSVTLNSVSLDQQSQRINYFLNISYNKDLLTR